MKSVMTTAALPSDVLTERGFVAAIATAQQQHLLDPGSPECMAHMLFDLLAGPVNRLRASLEPHIALDGLCENGAFEGRLAAFLKLYTPS